MAKEVTIKLPGREDFDNAMVQVLKVFLDTETKAKIYLYLRRHGKATADEIAKGAGLYPSSVREALVQMVDSKILKREKLEKRGIGKNPFIYEAIPAQELTKRQLKKVEEELNKLFNLDNYLKERKEFSAGRVKITIEKK
ncbi:MAG: helix-turn-helix domain-containing protein [Candidatus Methanofastidiosia archaeon]